MKVTQPSHFPRKLVLANLALVLLVVAVERFPGECWWPTLLLAYSPQQIWLAPSAASAVYLLARRKWTHAAGMAALAGVVLNVLVGVPLPRRWSREESDLRVLTWNLYYGRGGPAVSELALALWPDVICLQEADPWAVDGLPKLLETPQFEGWHARTCGELVILSRFPLKRLGTTNSALWVAANVYGKEVVIVDVHLALPVSSRSGHAVDPSELYAAERRRRPQVRGLVENLPAGRPTIVCGDFNTPPNTRVYRMLSRVLSNSFCKSGLGLGLTYPRRFPVVRIDHIFVSRGLKPVRCWLPEVNASNHRPVCADLRFTAAN